MSLVARLIESAKMSGFPSVILVKTDDSEIMEEGKLMGDVVLERPASLCGAMLLTELTMEHVLMELSQEHKISDIVLLQPTSPIRWNSLIDVVIAKLLTDGIDSIVGAVRSPPPFFLEGPPW